MKITYLANARLPTEKAHGYQIIKMCQALSEQGPTVSLLHPYRRQPCPELSVDPFQYYGVPEVFKIQTLKNIDLVTPLAYGPKKFAPIVFFVHSLLWSLYATMAAKKQGADVYYTRSIEMAYWLVCMGMATVLEIHSIPRKGRKWLLKKVLREKSLQLVVALTSFIKDRLTNMDFPPSRVKVLPDGVDLALFEHIPEKLECRRQLQLPEDRPIIGYVGRFQTMEMEKGIPELIESMVHLRSVNGITPLLLCVGGPMSMVQNYLDRADSTGIPRQMLRFMDRVPNSEVPRVIKACDVCTIPWPWTEFSAYYTSPLKLFEYMAARVPIVASDLPSLKEILRHDENAWLVQPGDPSALAEGIRTLLTDQKRAQRLVQKAWEEVQRYTWETRAAQVIALMRENQGSDLA